MSILGSALFYCPFGGHCLLNSQFSSYIEYFHVISKRYNSNRFILSGQEPSAGQRSLRLRLQRFILSYSGYRADTREPVAIKAIQMSQVSNEVTQYLLEGEKKAMSTIKSPFVVKTYDIVQHRDYCYIVMELCSNGTLKEYIQRKGTFLVIKAVSTISKQFRCSKTSLLVIQLSLMLFSSIVIWKQLTS